jgi:hypothetical protein
MRKVSIVTSINKKIYDEYAHYSIAENLKMWKKNNINYFVYTEDFRLSDFIRDEKMTEIDLHSECKDLVELKNRHKDNKRARGLDRNLKPKELYLFDYIRFSNKSFSIYHALRNIPSDLIIWLDADTVTHTEIPDSFFQKLCSNNELVAILKRPKTYTETGFICFNKNHHLIKKYLDISKNVYDKDLVFTEKYFNEKPTEGYTDANIFDYSLKKLEEKYGKFKIENLNKNNINAHPFINSVLGLYMDHFKGIDRKKNKRSNLVDIQNKDIKNLAYWKNIDNKK